MGKKIQKIGILLMLVGITAFFMYDDLASKVGMIMLILGIFLAAIVGREIKNEEKAS